MISMIDIHKRFEGVEVLRGINLQVAKGEVCVLLGPSGGGKSTLLRMINGLESFDQGTVQVEDLVLYPPLDRAREITLRKIRQRVGMVFQQFHLFPHRSVLQNIIEAPIRVLGQDRKEAIELAKQLLDRVGLLEKADAYPNRLSGGQQQRVAIARALAMNPAVILFDEPTSALDPKMSGEVTRVISDLAEGGQTMIIVTHAMTFARQVAHRVHVMAEGQIAESGTPDKIFESPNLDLTREFLQEAKA